MKEGMDALGRMRAQAVVLLLLAFLAGAFAGGAMERVNFRQLRQGRVGRPRPTRDRVGLPPYFETLGLSDAQRTRIDEIVRKRSPRVDSVMKVADAVLGPARDSTRREIDDVLTAEQRQKLDSLRPRGRGIGVPGLRGAARVGSAPPTP